ncbi:NAD(P)-binding oxidoreductase [Aureimonas glaciei]|nr:NAD(P)-binding oxidoreductase [Aureimonas glaciei]
MKVFVVGIGGGVGRRVAKKLTESGDEATGPVRRPQVGNELATEGISTVPGNIVTMSVGDLAGAMRGSDAVVFTAGAGGKDRPDATVQIDGDGPSKLAAAAELAGVRHFILVSVFPEAWRERRMDDDFELYMAEKKKAETKLVLTDLDWVIVRPSALTDRPGAGRVDLGLTKIHDEISRDDVADTIIELLRNPDLHHVILEVTAGAQAIVEAVAAIKGWRIPNAPAREALA